MKNLVRAMEEMKEAGYWLVGLDERAEKNYNEVDLKGQSESCWEAKAKDCTN